MKREYVPLDLILKLCPKDNDIVGYKPSYLREQILKMPKIIVDEKKNKGE